ncbi:MAG: helix-hairpin-helix domain-containing protein [Bacteroidaceae bacterium]|nr:helix-hairpin-helix domain-containing protein [Bacteroidaceae bacterium]
MAYFDSSSSERRGMLLIAIALVAVVAVGLVGYLRDVRGETPGREAADNTGVRPATPAGKSRYYAVPERKVETFAFDPNEADSTALLRLGFAPYMVRNIYKYRARGGRYHEPRDLRHTYGMTNELWNRIEPYIRIGSQYQYVEPEPRDYPRHETASAPRDTLLRPLKLSPGQTLALNEADTTALKRIPGIGSYYARQIVRRRTELGGFASLAQLQEIDGMPEGVEQYLRVEPSEVQHISVNHATKSQLMRHPYLRGGRGPAIWNHCHNVGPLRSLDDLHQLPGFTASDVERLAPYLEFN